MTDMIERAARAIAEALGDELDMVPVDKREWIDERGMFGGVFRDINAPFRSDYEDAARAVLQAIREPSEAMVDASFNDSSRSFILREGRPPTPEEDVAEQWRMMIDAALKE